MSKLFVCLCDKMSDPNKVKVVLIGNSTVGKTAIFHRIQKNEFSLDSTPTIGGACANITHEMDDGRKVQFIIWDTAGQETYRGIVPMYFSRAAFIFIVYDISQKSTFAAVEDWLRIAKERAPGDAKYGILGNKCDLESQRMVQVADGKKLAERLDAFVFLETSALRGEGIRELMSMLCTVAVNNAETVLSSPTDQLQEARGICC